MELAEWDFFISLDRSNRLWASASLRWPVSFLRRVLRGNAPGFLNGKQMLAVKDVGVD